MQPQQLPTVDPNNQFSAPNNAPVNTPLKPPHKNHFIRYLQENRILLPIMLLILIPAIFAILVYKYDIFGLIKKQHYSIQIIDAQTMQPLSNASVTMRGQTVVTNQYGLATFNPIKIGDSPISISHVYYQNFNGVTLVTFTNHNFHVFGLKNIGTEVRVSITNKINQTPIPNVKISALQNSVLTNSEGLAVINLPTGLNLIKGNVSVDNFNEQDVVINSHTNNDYTLIPTGKAYYLTNTPTGASFVSSNLDGSNQSVLMAGPKNSNQTNSQILNSNDSHYIAIVMPGSNNIFNLSIYNTQIGTFTNIAQSPLGFTLDGFTPDSLLVYTLIANGIPGDNGSASTIYALNVTNNSKPYVIDTASQGGFDAVSAAQQNYNFVGVLSDDGVVDSKYWTGSTTSVTTSPTTITYNSAKTDKPFSLPPPQQSLNYSNSYQIAPQVAYTSPTTLVMSYKNTSTGKISYFSYSGGKIISADATKTAAILASPPTSSSYYLSPAGSTEMWARVKNGNTLIYEGDKNGNNPQVIATFSGTAITPYAWYNDEYLLLNSSNNSLYIMPASGYDNQTKVQKIASFFP